MKKLDLTGMKFGRLTAIETTGEKRNGVYVWKCVCACGNERDVKANVLKSKKVTSCGCWKIEKLIIDNPNSKHNCARWRNQTPEYQTWVRMKQRCYNPKCKGYKNYGGRGIIVCDRWLHSFPNFLEDTGERPEGMSLDRINNNGNYEPSNCRWATSKQQSNNRRNVKLTDNDRSEIKTLFLSGEYKKSELAKRYNVHWNVIHSMVRR